MINLNGSDLCGLSLEGRLHRRLIQQLIDGGTWATRVALHPDKWQDLLWSIEHRPHVFTIDLTNDKPEIRLVSAGRIVNIVSDPNCPLEMAQVLT